MTCAERFIEFVPFLIMCCLDSLWLCIVISCIVYAMHTNIVAIIIPVQLEYIAGVHVYHI